MKITSYIISIIGFIIVLYNITMVDISSPFTGDSIIALISILCGLCAILIVNILRISKKIQKLDKNR